MLALKILTVAAFVAVMAALGWGLKVWVPPFNSWMGTTFGEVEATALVFGVAIVFCAYGYWPRRPDGSMRRLRSPWD